MQTLILAAVLGTLVLSGCATGSQSSSSPAQPGLSATPSLPKLSSTQWEACADKAYKEISSRLHSKGLCGAGNCYDEENRSLEELVVLKCGYQPSSSVDRQALKEVGNAMSAKRAAAYLAPDDPIHEEIARLDKEDAERREKQEADLKAKINARGWNINKVQIGMSEYDVRKIMGPPDDANITETRYSISKQLVYGLGRYVYTDNGVVTAIQH